MKKQLAKGSGFAAGFVMVLAFFAACATTGDHPAPARILEPIPPADLNPAVFDDFNHGFASPLNGHNGTWGNNIINDTGLGYWFGGVSSESMVLYDGPPAGQPPPFNNRVATFGLASSENGWGRSFQNRDGTPTPLGAPDAIGVRFWAHEVGVAFLGSAWALYIHAGQGEEHISASVEFRITAINQWQEFFLEFPEGFGSEWITGYDFWMRDFLPAATGPGASASMSIAQMMFVYPEP